MTYQMTPLIVSRVSGAIWPLKLDVGGEALFPGIIPCPLSSVAGQLDPFTFVELRPYRDPADIQDSMAVAPCAAMISPTGRPFVSLEISRP